MTQDQARVALEFLKRVDLKGVEAFVMVEVLRALNEIAAPQPNGDDRPAGVSGGIA